MTDSRPMVDLAWLDGVWHLRDADGAIRALEAPEDDGFASPACEADVRCVYLPVEHVPLRPFSLPLSHPRFLDADVLAQELEDQTGEDAGACWLAWRAGSVESGVRGLMAALPPGLREALDGCNPRHVRIDAPERLARRLPEEAPSLPLAVCDADAGGVCIGVFHAGRWLGVTRIARQPSLGDDGLREWALRALAAMGWEGGAAVGRLDAAAAGWFDDWRGETLEALPSRVEATLEGHAPAADGLEFRHGRWAPAGDFAWLAPWRGALALGALAALLWTGGMLWDNHRLQQRVEAAQARTTAALARALPGQPVIDALAQLRRAAGVGDGGGGADVRRWLAQMAAVARVFGRQAWTIRELEWRDGAMRMRGEAKDLQMLNRLRDALAAELGREVRLIDTTLGKDKVGFRMEWS